jgi:DNA-binding transcriptional regulator YiaG
MEVSNFNQEVSFMARPSKNPHSTIAQLRSALGIGQADLARLLGVSNITISNWENR